MSEQHPAHHGDLWPFVPEFEADLSPGENLDRWRGAEAFFAPLVALMEHSPNEQLQTTVYSAHNRVSEHARGWQERVREMLQENRDAGRLTPFGAVLAPLLERAGLTPKTLLIESGRIQEPHAWGRSCATCTAQPRRRRPGLVELEELSVQSSPNHPHGAPRPPRGRSPAGHRHGQDEIVVVGVAPVLEGDVGGLRVLLAAEAQQLLATGAHSLRSSTGATISVHAAE